MYTKRDATGPLSICIQTIQCFSMCENLPILIYVIDYIQ